MAEDTTQQQNTDPKPDAEQLEAEAAAAERAEDLKGKELDAALEQAGLSKTGTADEKRARLAAPRPKEPTHTNTYGDPVHVRDDLHAFVESRGYKPL